jgi:quercetin dioxygenase-like cupin family protein
MEGVRVVGLDEVEAIPWESAGVVWRPLRAALGVRAFGCAAFSGDRGERVVERHAEAGGGGRGHQEVYVVLRGAARFVVGGEEVRAEAGTFLCIDPEVEREAFAEADGTAVAVFGREPDFVVAGHEVILRVRAAAEPSRAREIAEEGRAEIGEQSPGVLYALALAAAVSGEEDEASRLLAKALAIEPDLRAELHHDPALASLRA